MTALSLSPSEDVRGSTSISLLVRLVLREFRAGLAGFGILIACIALGVAAIVAVASLSRGLSDGIAREGRAILGGDLSLYLIQREATPQERAALATHGQIGITAGTRAMARTPAAAALSELKAVDQTYPSHGTLTLNVPLPAGGVGPLLAKTGDAHGALLDPALAGRLNVTLGDRFQVGEAAFRVSGLILSEPDKLSGGVGFGPRLLVSDAALRDTGLLQPGSLIRWTYRLTLPESRSDRASLNALDETLRASLGPAGFGVTTRERASPQLQRQIERFTQFLTLVGLTALLVGGVGVANATRAFVDRQRLRIASLKSLGASGGFVFASAMLQVLAFAALATAIGLVLGVVLPFIAEALLKDLIPFPLAIDIYAEELASGALYGLVTAAAFSIWPLGRARDIPVSALFRDEVEADRSWPRWPYVIGAAAALAVLGGLAVFLAFDRRIALIYVAAAAGAFIALRLVAMAIMMIARRVPISRRTELRLAVINLHKPGALTPSVVLSLGLGLTLLVALVVIDTNLRAQLSRAAPGETPSFFFVDVPSRDIDDVETFLRTQSPGGKIERVPQLRGRITALNGTPAAEFRADERVSWVLDGDRGITYADQPPEGARITAGTWWEEGYRGPPLVSFGRDIADRLGLGIGDTVSVNVLGRTITATIANLREIEWQRFGINFILVFPRSTFAGAPHTHIATLTLTNGATPTFEADLARAMAERFPAVTSVRVREALDAVNDIVSQLTLAIRGASGVALVASLLVLAGALSSGGRTRAREAVVLKTLGATRSRILAAMILEFALLGAVAAIFGMLAGAAAAYAIVVGIMNLTFTLPWSGIAAIVMTALILTIGLGLLGTWHILGQKPAAYLRNA